MYKLIIQDDEGKTTVVPLIREELTIGRQEGNTIRLTERNVSRRHAKLLRGQEAIIIEDLDSYNGVRVNGSRIQGKAEIKEADRVQIGDYLIEVKAEQPAGRGRSRLRAETMQIPAIDASAPMPVADMSGSEAVTAPNSVPGSGGARQRPGLRQLCRRCSRGCFARQQFTLQRLAPDWHHAARRRERSLGNSLNSAWPARSSNSTSPRW